MFFLRDKILNKVIEWANAENSIKVAILEGSLVGSKKYIDELSDIDINLFCKSYTRFLNDDSWISKIADVLVYIPEKFEFVNKTVYTRLAIFQNGVKIDFSFWTLDMLEDIKNNTVPYYQYGYKVLLDKNNLSNSLPKRIRSYVKPNPSNEEYLTLVNEFWFEIHYVAKYLKRNELWSAKIIDFGIKENYLLKMLEWYELTKHNWNYNTFYNGKHIHQWLDKQIYQILCKVFTGFDTNQNWNSLFIMIELFRDLALKVARHLQYEYPIEVDKNMSNLIKRIFEMDI